MDSAISRVLAGVVLALLISTPGMAQGQGTGAIEGVVSDATGGVLPGVEVTVRNTGTNATRVQVTDNQGRYRVDLLQPAVYEISASQAGFSPAKIDRLAVGVGSLVKADLRMEVAGRQETVVVSGETSTIEPDRMDISDTVGERAVENLPINGRRWENFVLLTPGVTPDGNFGLVSYRGISGLYNNNSIDGADNNQAFFSEARGRTRVSYTISQASVKEFQVGLSNFSAEFGRAAGGTVNAVTKSGTNELHGQGFYFVRDQAFMAHNPRAKALGQDKPDERRQQFGISAGGPVSKDRVFFFATYDQQKRNFPGFVFPNVAFASVPCTAPGCAATISFLDSLTGQFPREGSNYVALGKLDWLINSKHTLAASYNFHKWDSPNGIQTQSIITVSTLANGSDGVRTDMVNLRLTSVLGAKTVNEFRFQFGRDFEFQTPNAEGPSVSFTNGISYGMPNFLPRPAYPNEKRFQFADNYSFIRGSHSLKAGFDINYVREGLINLFNGGGVYSYSSLNALAQDCPAQAAGCVRQDTGASTGKHYSSYQQAFDLRGLRGDNFFSTTDWNFFIQDSWKVRNDFTLQLGLRYEYSQLPQPESGNPAYPLTMSLHKDANNLGPRFGFSWDIGGAHRTVLRGGYGLYYGRTSNSAVSNGLLNNGLLNAGYFFTPSSAGAPVFPNVLSAPPSGSQGSTTIQFFSKDYVRPLIHSVDLVLERELGHGIAISGSFLFSRGQRLPLFRDVNLPQPTGTVTYILPDGNAAAVFPLYLGSRPDSSAGQLILSESVVNSSYNGFVLVLSKRFSRGVQFSSNFTVAKALDDGQTSTTFFGGNQPFDSLNRQFDRGLSNFDVRKRSVTHLILAPSVDRLTQSRGVRALLNDWRFSGILTLSDGRPIDATITGSLSSAIGSVNSSRTNGSGGDARVPFIAKNSFAGTGQATFDLRMGRRLRLSEGSDLELFWEAFNLFNRVNYTSHQTTLYRVASSSRTGNSAVVTLGEPSGLAFGTPINVGNTLYGPREFQIGMKFSW